MWYFEKDCIHWKAARDFGLLDYLDDKQKFGIQLAILSSLKVVSEDFISPSQRNSYPKNISNLISWPPYITLLLISLMLFVLNLKAFNKNLNILNICSVFWGLKACIHRDRLQTGSQNDISLNVVHKDKNKFYMVVWDSTKREIFEYMTFAVFTIKEIGKG